VKTPGMTPGHWTVADGGDGGAALIDPSNPLTMYHTYSVVSGEIGIVRSLNGGLTWSFSLQDAGITQSDRVLFYPPLALDPSRAGTLYLGTNNLYRSTNQGSSWTQIGGDLTRNLNSTASTPAISTIAVAPANDQDLFVGTS